MVVVVVMMTIIIIIITTTTTTLGNTVQMNGQMQVIIHNYYTKELKKSVIIKMKVRVILILKENREGCAQHFYGMTSERLLVQRRSCVMLWTTV